MNRIFRIYIALFLAVFGWSCEEDLVEKAVINDVITPSDVTALSSDSYTLDFDQSSADFETFSWSAADYGVNLSVTYSVEMGVSGAAFDQVQVLGTTQDLSLTVTNGDINTAVLNLGAEPATSFDVEVRVVAIVEGDIDDVNSEVISFAVVSYEVTFPPIYMIGGAIGWNLDEAVELTSVSPGEYEGIGPFVTGQTFRFFETPSWDAPQINADDFEGGTIPPEFSHSGDGDANFNFSGTDGTYAIYVNLNTQTITISDPPTLYIIGADQGWSLDDAFSLTAIGPTTFKGTTTFTNGSIFRFFEIPDWGATQYNYNTFLDGSIPTDLTGTTEGDANFTFNGATGAYEITVSLSELTITMEPGEIEEPEPEPSGETLFIIGDDQGWDLGAALQLEDKGNGVFEVVGNFNNAGTWRLFAAADWGATQYGYSYFTGGVSGDLGDNGDGDSNFIFNGTTGIHKITVDLENLTIASEASTAPPLYVVGDHNGWSFEALTWVEGGKFTISVTLADGNTFRFMSELDNWSSTAYGHGHFENGVTDALGAQGDGDDNFVLAGTAGTYTINVDLFGKVISTE